MEALTVSIPKDSIVGKCFCDIRMMADSLCEFVHEAAQSGRSLYDSEKAVLQQILLIGHKAMDALLQFQGTGDLGVSVTTEEGRTLKRSETPHDRPLRTIFGQHLFQQYVYSRGANRKIELRPIDARLSLSPRISSYLLEEFSQLFCIEAAFGQSATNLQRVFGQQLSVDTLESISHSMGADAETYLDTLPAPVACEEGELLVATMDAKGVPLFSEQPDKVKAFETRKQRPGNRRMATLAGVYSVDRYVRTPEQIVAALFREEIADGEDASARPAPKFKHLSAHFPEFYEDGPDSFTSTGALEACGWTLERIEDRRKKGQSLLVLIDGDHCLWNTVASLLPEDTIGILDIVHVSSYVWQASELFCQSKSERETFTRSRLRTILEGGVRSVIRSLRHLATSRGLRGEARRQIARITNYFESHAERMRYDEYLSKGYPIATGVIEGACRHLVKDRMERSGMRWTLEGAKAMLNVRAVHESKHWDQFQETRRTNESKRFDPYRFLVQQYVLLTLAC
jgi:hypothetical protein